MHPQRMKIAGTETADNPAGLVVSEAGARRWARVNMPADLRRAGFSPVVTPVDPTQSGRAAWYWRIMYGRK